MDGMYNTDTLVLNYATASVICEGALMTLNNTGISRLIIVGLSSIPLAVRELQRLNYVQVDAGLFCNCTLTLTFYDYFNTSSRRLVSNCTNDARMDASTYIREKYEDCKMSLLKFDYCIPTINSPTRNSFTSPCIGSSKQTILSTVLSRTTMISIVVNTMRKLSKKWIIDILHNKSPYFCAN